MKSFIIVWTFFLFVTNFVHANIMDPKIFNSKRTYIFITNAKMYVIDKNLSFGEANEYCWKNYNSYLTTIRNEVDFKSLVSAIQKLGTHENIWIGLTSYGGDDIFYWLSGFQGGVPYQRWRMGYPVSKIGGHNCVVMSQSQDSYDWTNLNCSARFKFSCSDTYDLTNLTTVPTKQAAHRCPSSFFQIQDSCFRMSTINSSWQQQRQMCQSYHNNSDLAVFDNVYQSDYIAALTYGHSTGYWTGLELTNNHYNWLGVYNTSFTNWGPNEPKNKENYTCSYMCGGESNLGQWFSDDCNTAAGFRSICQIRSFVKDVATPELYDDNLFHKLLCGVKGHLYYNGSCYYISIPSLNHSRDMAASLCSESRTSGHRLAGVANVGQLKFLLSLLRKHHADTRSSLGGSPKQAWIDVMAEVNLLPDSSYSIEIENSFVDSLELAIPNSQNSTEKSSICFFVSTNGSILTGKCSEAGHFVRICSYIKKKEVPVDVEKTLRCQSDWTLFRDKCYKWKYTPFSRHHTKYECLSVNATLVSIEDEETHRFLHNKTLEKLKGKTDNFWIGLELSVKINSTVYRWDNKAILRYIRVNISKIQMASSAWKRYCAVMGVQFEWQLLQCDTEKSMVICQKFAYTVLPIDMITSTDTLSSTSTMPSSTTSLPTSTTTATSTTATTTTMIKPPPQDWQLSFTIEPQPYTWDLANKYCEHHHLPGIVGHLASFRNFSEMNEVVHYHRHLIYGGTTFWIGLRGVYNRFDNVFLGWIDSTRLSFQVYNYENLLNATSAQNCVALDVNTLTWLVADCSLKKPSICGSQRDLNFHPSMTDFRGRWMQAKLHKTVCPHGFYSYNNKCFHVSKQQKTWEQAGIYCGSLSNGASLAVIGTKYENSFVYSLLPEADHAQHLKYWISGKTIMYRQDMNTYCNAMSAHPDPYVGARWFVALCTQRLSVVCSVDIYGSVNEETAASKHDCPPIFDIKGLHGRCYSVLEHPNTRLEADRYVMDHKLPVGTSLLTLPSHRDMHRLLAELAKRSLTRDVPLWLGARLLRGQDPYHWLWDQPVGGHTKSESVRYTVWRNPPTLPDSVHQNLCFYFINEPDMSGDVGMKIEPCNSVDRKFIVLEYIPKNSGKLRPFESSIDCRTGLNKDYFGHKNTTVSGGRCLRWDMLGESSKGRQLQFWFRHSKRSNFIGQLLPQYQANECRYLPQLHHNVTLCAIELYPELILRECAIPFCKATKQHHHHLTLDDHSRVVTIMLVLLMVIAVLISVFGLFAWRRWSKHNSLFGGAAFFTAAESGPAGSSGNGGSEIGDRRPPSRLAFLTGQSRGTSFNNPIYRPVVSC